MNFNDDLVASFTNIKVLQGRFPGIELDFVLTNQSKKPIYLAERWNSWGYFQWSFQIVDVKGNIFPMKPRGRSWPKNFLTTLTLLPNEQQILSCHLSDWLAVGESYPLNLLCENQKKAVFLAIGSYYDKLKSGEMLYAGGRPKSFVYPLKLTGEFAAPNPFIVPERNWPKGIEKSTKLFTWKGKIETDTLLISQDVTVKNLGRPR
jgi:hypothetical protein